MTEAILLQKSEKRMIASVDLNRMSKIKYVNKKSMYACIECGILGSQIDAELAKFGVCLGHEPDSIEFSTLGGWISTRASGMKKNTYGNIEDIVMNVKIVSSNGTFEKKGVWQRVSNGPDITQIILGSEGLLGIITEAVVKVRKIPDKKVYDSIIFPDFKSGVKFLEAITRMKIFPASIRLMDNNQIKFALAFREEESAFQRIISKFKNFYLTVLKRFNSDTLCMATLLYEGNANEVDYQSQSINSIYSQFGGIRAGAEAGIRGYFITFVIAYIRDLAMEHNYIIESFETTVPWEKVIDVCKEATAQIQQSCKREKTASPYVTFRVSQIYDSGVTLYCYFGFSTEGVPNPVESYSRVECDARNIVLKNGGSLSHHHGIGKLRKEFVSQIMPDMAQRLLIAIKKEWDPKNIFATNNIINI